MVLWRSEWWFYGGVSGGFIIIIIIIPHLYSAHTSELLIRA